MFRTLKKLKYGARVWLSKGGGRPETLDINGRSTVIMHGGDGPPFVYLHSTLGESLMWLPFYGFRVMYFLGTIMFCAALYSVWLRLRHRLFTSRAYLRLMVFLLPSGFVCVLGGWITAETGRQPWVVYGILRTANSVSPVSAHSVLTSLVMFIAVYGVLLVGFLALMTRVLQKGPIEFPLLHAPSGTVRRVFVHDGALHPR